MRKRLVALLLCTVLALTLLPGTALADDGDLLITFTGGGTPVPGTDYTCETDPVLSSITDPELRSAKVNTVIKAAITRFP